MLALRITLACCSFLALLCGPGCYAPDLSKVRYTCDVNNPFCPDGQTCVSGCCGGPPCSGMPSAGDGGGASGGKTCAIGDPVEIPGAGPDVIGCPGAFAEGQLAALCGSDYEQCETKPGSVSDSVCASLTGRFFASKQIACQNSFGTTPRTGFNCTWQCAMDPSKRYVVGCGTSAGDSGGSIFSYTVDPPLERCGGFNRATVCNNGQSGGGTSSTWRCPMSQPPANADTTTLSSVDALDGALCCKKKSL